MPSASREEELFSARSGTAALAEQSDLSQCSFKLAFSGVCIRRPADEVRAVGGDAAHVELDSPSHFDAFLKEWEQQVLYGRRKAMQVTGENMKPDIAAGQWFTAMVPTIPIMLEARDHGRDVCIRLHLGNRGKTAGQGLVVEAVVPSLEAFCMHLGFQVKDVVWHFREGVELTEETRSEPSSERFNAVWFFGW